MLDMRAEDASTTRDAFGRAVLEAMREDDTIVALSADTETSMGFGPAKAAFPDRVINVGIAEQNMVGMAAGMASVGKRVVVGTYAPFLSLRALEQVRTFLCYPRFPVVLAGALGGLSGGIEGVTHQGTEDVAVMRSLANMRVFAPADAAAAAAVTKAALTQDGPVYVRLGRYRTARVYGGGYRFQPGCANCIAQGDDLALLAYGPAVYQCLLAAQRLAEEGIGARVLDMAAVKPIDREAVLRCARETRGIITAEDHTVIGGLGSAVAEVLSEEHPAPVMRLGLRDTFAESGDQQALMQLHGLCADQIVRAAKKLLSSKE